MIQTGHPLGTKHKPVFLLRPQGPSFRHSQTVSYGDAIVEFQAQRKVCVIDDDDAVRESMRAVLESFGIDVSDYPSAGDFLARVAAPPNGCMLLDLHMPGMSGLELLEVMRQRGWELPVIAMTGRSDDLLKERVLRAGVVALLDKPIGESTLTHALDRAFARSAAEA